MARLIPHIPDDAREDALRRVVASERPSLIEENRRLHRAEDRTIRGDAVRLPDPDDRLNDWLAIARFTVAENGTKRRPHVVVFLNGPPVGVIDVEKPGPKTRPWLRPSTSRRPARRKSRRCAAPMPCLSRATGCMSASAR